MKKTNELKSIVKMRAVLCADIGEQSAEARVRAGGGAIGGCAPCCAPMLESKASGLAEAGGVLFGRVAKGVAHGGGSVGKSRPGWALTLALGWCGRTSRC